MPHSSYDILVDRTDLGQVRVSPTQSPAPGMDQIHVRIETFALTANNITYAVMGETMKYWSVFPAPGGSGRIPVWGFGRVVASSHPQVATGERLYGFWPMSSDTILTIGRASPGVLIDATPHRKNLAAVYNTYTRLVADPTTTPDNEPFVALLRPLFATSFLIDDYLASESFFGADAVLITSATSKTAIGLAHCLRQRGAERPRIIGLTSSTRAAFAEALGYYDIIETYDAIAGLAAPGGVVVVDLAGSIATLRAIHSALGSGLKYSCRVGFTHWHDTSPEIADLPGVRPAFFFAPERVQTRLAEWGAEEFGRRIGVASAAFIATAHRWLKLDTRHGPEAIVAAYRSLLNGHTRADTGIICIP
jgi:hypothetical protein